jgi:7-keto-8-aminopelargonate synthetase-like enzyme
LAGQVRKGSVDRSIACAAGSDGALIRSGEAADFTGRDRLGLARHPRVLAAELAADGGNAEAVGGALHEALAALSGAAEARVFGTAAAALRAVMSGVGAAGGVTVLVAAGTDPTPVLAAAPPVAAVQAIRAAGLAALVRRLEAAAAGGRRVLLVAEALTLAGRGRPDLSALQAACRRVGAVLLAEVSRDLGLVGRTGRGVAEVQGMLGEVDLMVGRLSPGLGVSAGFAAARSGGPALPPGQALPPALAQAALAAAEIAGSAEGMALRSRLEEVAQALMGSLAAAGLAPRAESGAAVSLAVGSAARARQMAAELAAEGIFVEVLPPSGGAGRLRLNAAAGHRPAQVIAATEALRRRIGPFVGLKGRT